MREKVGEKLLITLALAVLLSEMLNACVSIYGNSPILKVIAMVSSIAFVVWLWTYFVITKERKKYKKRQEAIKKVIKAEDFDKIYNQLKKEHREYLETKRKSPRDRLKFRYILLAVAGGTMTLGLFYLLCGNPVAAKGLIKILFLIVVALLATFWGDGNDILEYKAAYKLRIINSLLKHINPKLEYVISFSDEDRLLFEYENANFGLFEHNTYECIDKIEGETEAGYLELAELKLGYNTVMENGKTRRIDVFNGFFGMTELGVEEWFKLKLSAVGVKSRAGILEVGTDKIKLDSKEFMDSFTVQTNDKMIATRILTSDIMTELVDYKEKYGITLDISIKNGKIYFLLYTGDMLEPAVINDSMNKDVILKDYAIIKLITELAQKISKIVKEVQS